MAENREVVLVMKRIKVPVATADGMRQEIRIFEPGALLPRADWDRFPARSRRSMSNTGFVRDPLNVQIDTRTGKAQPMPTPRKAKVVLRAPRTITQIDRKTGEPVITQDPGGLDRRLGREQSQTTGDGAVVINTTATETTGQPVKRKRGRPRKVKE